MTENEIVYQMLIELLACQFAHPVQWIDTQDALLGEKRVERFIEIGPSNTLTTMAKRTSNSLYLDHDIAQSITREFLSCEANESEIYYDLGTEEPVEDILSRKVEVESTPSPSSTSSMSVLDLTQPATTTAGLVIFTPQDTPVPVADIVQTIIAVKLKKNREEIPLSGSIKKFAGGRSTVENEIVGDLVSEFGTLPEGPEDCVLRELCDSIELSFDGILGKQSSKLVERFVASKMPGGFGIGAARKHLESRWAFGLGHQDRTLLLAVSSEPYARLQSDASAMAYFDCIAQKHSKNAGLSTMAAEHAKPVNKEIDPEALSLLRLELRDIAQKNLEVYAGILKVDLLAGEKATTKSQESLQGLQEELYLWRTEHGGYYESGIKPTLDIRKVRIYDSAWNWATEALLRLFYDTITGRVLLEGVGFEDRCASITNRSSPDLLKVMRYLLLLCKGSSNKHHRAAEVLLEKLKSESEAIDHKRPIFRYTAVDIASKTIIDDRGKIYTIEVSRGTTNEASRNTKFPALSIMRKGKHGWQKDTHLSKTYHDILHEMSTSGVSLERKNVLLTGAGRGSIGAELLRSLLSAGANVVVTTSNFSIETTKFFQAIYRKCGSLHSRLVLVPYNQGSVQDVEALAEFIYDTKGLRLDLDFVIPFAAFSEADREIDNVDSKSELAHRVMLTNTIRLLGAIKHQKQHRGYVTRPAQVILPLSPNHGSFGGDGLYAESKLALESLSSKWASEKWSDYLCICGASIGWTRGTGLMSSNDLIAPDIENLGIRTYTQLEMAVNILGLMTPSIVSVCQSEPLYADLNGGLDNIEDLGGVLRKFRKSLDDCCAARRVVSKEKDVEERRSQSLQEQLPSDTKLQFRARLDVGFPTLPDYKKDIKPLTPELLGMVDLDRVVVATGFSELGPCGSARTRWELEAYGVFSLAGCVEMAWIMGLIKYVSRAMKKQAYSGWVDVKTDLPISDMEIKLKYEEYMVEHSGIRLIEPEVWGHGYDPHKKQILQEVVIQEDLEPFKASQETAENFKREHGDKVDILHMAGSVEYKVCIKKGATLLIPKAIKFRNDVAGQLPTGWNPRTYGISEDIISQVDPITLFVLVCTAEALVSAGITDAFEIYKYTHGSKVGNCIGTGNGGAASSNKLHKQRYTEKPVQNDILQEAFLNTTSAWVNMLLLSSHGPIRTPVGACATSVESLDSACDLIVNGKAELCFVGGVDDLEEDTSYEFANMNATSNANDERAAGRDPKEMSRPAASSRKGFMESQGCGVQVVTSAKLALEMGLPIYAIIAFTGTASDNIGRSVPAPGKGILVNAREDSKSKMVPSPLLDINYRKRQLTMRQEQILEFKELELQSLEEEILDRTANDPSLDVVNFRHHRIRYIELEVRQQYEDARNNFGNCFWKNDTQISPIRGALGAWGLTIDDVEVCSFHGTSTVLNEKNECDILQQQFSHLGRSEGNKALGVFQKHLTGHPKGPAGAWMLNGCFQIFNTGLVPGNRNADNIDKALQKYDYIAFPTESIQTLGIKAISLTSFGFGQKGTQAIVIHPKYLFATLDEESYKAYAIKSHTRQRKATAYHNKALITNSVVRVKSHPLFPADREYAAALDPNARFGGLSIA